ncbi:hypothetical protein ACP275_03G031200 [Erythranthe tilingii]
MLSNHMLPPLATRFFFPGFFSFSHCNTVPNQERSLDKKTNKGQYSSIENIVNPQIKNLDLGGPKKYHLSGFQAYTSHRMALKIRSNSGYTKYKDVKYSKIY